ncbi:magnesium/cobalt transporter CorA [Caldibacillus lycopersici]|uniref:Magnesium transport protein CorA n=1 Tax=Perspicuibacillus lycopersici TaxID=1325689 RepID=A0AAE3LME6_9BACI|nr:magnesium/cobalt transporter CorA [Perspicuibacillus lycopersici]MCU9613495.1 magnesium/cobalt transporter CorA [Perspicuibacillus lycopersici]
MIRTFIITNDGKIKSEESLNSLSDTNIHWFWVDFDSPTDEETACLRNHFKFHPLAIEDCLLFLQRPKLDHYDGYDFFVTQAIDQSTLSPIEIDVFVGAYFIVTFHLTSSIEIKNVQNRLFNDESIAKKGAMYIFYLIMDEIVDEYFPNVYQLEDSLNEIEMEESDNNLVEDVFKIRRQLLKLRRIVFPMRELLYRILNSERLIIPKEDRAYFMDIHDHLLKLSEIIESNREMTNDIRDSYLSLNSDRMNSIMKTLTVMSSIFIPLTFIGSIYGMNFQYMPELGWRWGYFGVLGLMFVVGFGMAYWLWSKGWFK